jgi:hypothetical protein
MERCKGIRPMSLFPEHPDDLGDDLDRVKEILDAAEENSELLTAWEEEFCSSLRERVATYGARTRVSEKQHMVIDSIEQKVFGT